MQATGGGGDDVEGPEEVPDQGPDARGWPYRLQLPEVRVMPLPAFSTSLLACLLAGSLSCLLACYLPVKSDWDSKGCVMAIGHVARRAHLRTPGGWAGPRLGFLALDVWLIVLQPLLT